MAAFRKESTQYGVLYYPIVNRAENTGTVEIMAKARDARQINHILEKLGIDLPDRQKQEEGAEKKAPSRVPSEERSREYGTDTPVTTEQSMNTDKPERAAADVPKQRPSVRKKVEGIKAAQRAQREMGQPQRGKDAPVVPPWPEYSESQGRTGTMKRIFTALCCAVLLLCGSTSTVLAAEQQTCDNPKPPAVTTPVAQEPTEPDPVPLYPPRSTRARKTASPALRRSTISPRRMTPPTFPQRISSETASTSPCRTF